MKYTELLEIARKNNIDIVKLTIAHELESCLGTENKISNEDEFECLCAQVYEIYLSIDSYDLNAIIRIILNTIYDEEEKLILANKYDNDLEEYVRQKL